MRAIYDPLTGGNNTATALSFLKASQTLVTAYLYTLEFTPAWDPNPSVNTAFYTFTDFDAPVNVKTLQMAASGVSTPAPTAGLNYLPNPSISFDQLEYGIGFEDRPVTVKLGLDDSVNYLAHYNTSASSATSPANAQSPDGLTLRQAFLLDAFRDCPFWIHQAVYTDFPALGGTFLGTALMFRGFLRKVNATASSLAFTASSLMDVFQQVKVPTQTLTPNNRALAFALGPIIQGANTFGASTFVIVSPTVFQMSTGGASYTYNQLRDCWMTTAGSWDVFSAVAPPARSGQPPAPSWRVIGNDATVSGVTTIYFEKPPIVSNLGGLFTLFSQNALSGGSPGFPYVPPPEFSA